MPIALEERGLCYETHRATLSDEDVKSPEFLSLGRNNRIPAIIDRDGPDGGPLGRFESGAILLYLVETTGRFIGRSAADRHRITQWLILQMGGVGLMCWQPGFFWKFAGREVESPVPRDRYMIEARRLPGVVEARLDGRDWIAGDHSIADMALTPWLRALDFHGARQAVNWEAHPRTVAYFDRFLARPAVQAGLDVPPRGG